MAITTIIAGGTSGSERTVFVFDALTDKQIQYDSDITKHPVEAGSDITDHVVNKNTKIQMVGVITNTPVEGLIDSISQNRDVEDSGNRVQQAYDLLKQLRQSKRPFTVVTEVDTFPTCLISSLSFPEEPGKSNLDALEVKMDLEQVRIVGSEELFLSEVQEDDSRRTTHEGSKDTLEGAQFESGLFQMSGISE